MNFECVHRKNVGTAKAIADSMKSRALVHICRRSSRKWINYFAVHLDTDLIYYATAMS